IPHIAALMTSDVGDLVRRSDTLVVGLKTPDVLNALETARPEQLLLDVAGLPERDKLKARYQGICW
ncbi:MAG: GDP-mannose dehydrogenase, partial [Gemmatimonadetes bacterium]|nr:GDP-mannose dehydrogenase [Gemmatimonadota bacterium]